EISARDLIIRHLDYSSVVTASRVHLESAIASVSSHQQTAVHYHHLPCHVPSSVGCKKQNDVGDLFRLADPAHRNELARLLGADRPQRMLLRQELRRPDVSGRNAITPTPT